MSRLRTFRRRMDDDRVHAAQSMFGKFKDKRFREPKPAEVRRGKLRPAQPGSRNDRRRWDLQSLPIGVRRPDAEQPE